MLMDFPLTSCRVFCTFFRAESSSLDTTGDVVSSMNVAEIVRTWNEHAPNAVFRIFKFPLDQTMAKLPMFTLIGRVVVLVSTIISFFCCTAVTGVSAGDYAFLVSFIALAYTLLHAYFVTFKRNVTFTYMTQLIIDAVLAILLFAGAIAVVTSPWAKWYGLPGAGTAAVVFIFFATAAQIAVIVMQVMAANRSDEPTLETPPNVYVPSSVPAGDTRKRGVELQA
ncbi:hypothetical protein AC1031_017700 [Aphanomyces cochlioides]|nr:hypothetical protein AC1031_017700 [Aphanomyces cochlioides]